MGRRLAPVRETVSGQHTQTQAGQDAGDQREHPRIVVRNNRALRLTVPALANDYLDRMGARKPGYTFEVRRDAIALERNRGPRSGQRV